jgi:hypothetical protein
MRCTMTCKFIMGHHHELYSRRMFAQLQAVCGEVLQTMSLGMCLLSSLLHIVEKHYAVSTICKCTGPAGVQLAPPVQSPTQAVPTTQALASAVIITSDSQVSPAGKAAPEQQPVQPAPPLKSVESIDLTAESDGEAT